jgi:6-phosphofructokinase 1
MIYVDPTYAIRSVPANATDTLLCTTLSRDAVHGAMYGLTDFSVGTIRNTNCLIPVETMIDGGTNKVSIKSRVWNNSLITLNN